MVFCVVNRSCGETRGSSCSRRRKASIFSLGQSERLAKVRWRVFLPSRQPSRRRMAGGELRLGTTAIYMRTLTNINPNLSREIYRYMRTQINENQVAARAKPHIFKILTSNRASTVGWNFGLTAPVANAYRMAIASQGVIAISDGFSTIQFFTLQNDALLAGPAVQTSVSPQDLAFRPDGNVLYALNAGGAIAVFSVAPDLSLQLIQDAPLPLVPGQLGGNAVRIRLNAAGNKIAATTLDGWVYVGDVNGTDGTVSGITEAQAAPNANLQEVVLDPTGQNVYTDDQDNGGIYEFSTAGGALTALPGSPVATPLGSMGMETDSTGTRLYLGTPGFPSSQIVTFSRDLSSGKLRPLQSHAHGLEHCVIRTVGILANAYYATSLPTGAVFQSLCPLQKSDISRSST